VQQVGSSDIITKVRYLWYSRHSRGLTLTNKRVSIFTIGLEMVSIGFIEISLQSELRWWSSLIQPAKNNWRKLQLRNGCLTGSLAIVLPIWPR
jgi:hypothetical protein